MHFLQANGISFDVIDKEGNTPLHFAAENNNKETTLFLLI